MTGDLMVGAQWLVGWKSLSRPFARWTVIVRWLVPVTGHAWWLVTGHTRSAGYIFFSIGRLAGGRWVSRRKPGDHCPVACGLILPWVQVPRELPPIWVFLRLVPPCGAVLPCLFFLSSEEIEGSWDFLLAIIAFFLAAKILLLSARIQKELYQLLHVEQVDSLEQREQLIDLLWLSQCALIWSQSPQWIVMKVAKTHYDKWVNDKWVN